MSGYRFEHYRLDVDRRVLIARERVIPLSEKIFGVLLCLVRAAGRTVTKDELIAEVWGQEDTSEATLVQHVSLLRKLLDERPASHKYVLTVPRVGYRFIPRVAHDGEPLVKLGLEAIGDGSQRGEPRIWREYFSGKHWAERRDRNGLNLALRHFSAALRIDRTFAPAWIGIAATYCSLAYYAFTTWDRVLPSAEHAIAKAIEFDPGSGLAHCMLAEIQLAQWDIAGLERSLERAGELDSRSADAYGLRAFFDAWRGESDAAVVNAKRAMAIAPGDIALHGIFAGALAAQGDYRNAIASYSKILDADPSCQIARQGRCEAYVADGRLDLASSDLEQMPRTAGNLSRLACVQAFLGDTLGASRLFKELHERAAVEYVEPHCLAQVLIALGRYDEAVGLTHQAIASHNIKFPAMLNSPLLQGPMKNARLRRMLGDVQSFLFRANRKTG
jgi:DNA-binding winged helix-turn-helix (wHTH) protein/tetratricopeptide (TPR) repeat protein